MSHNKTTMEKAIEFYVWMINNHEITTDEGELKKLYLDFITEEKAKQKEFENSLRNIRNEHYK